jgi:hypothetical protein
MVIKPKSLSFSIFGASTAWELGKTNKDIARRTIRFLEDRRLLFGARGQHANDTLYCVHSTIEIRKFLNDQLQNENPGKVLRQALQEMRAACRRFLDHAGPNAENFQTDRTQCLIAVGELRTTFGFYLGALAVRYRLDVDEDLASILPPQADQDDPSIVPGM